MRPVLLQTAEMKSATRAVIAGFLFSLCCAYSSASAQTLRDDRTYEHVTISPLNLAEFSGDIAPVTQLHLYAYRSGAWQQVPFQIDERGQETGGASNSYFPDAKDGLLDDNDDVVFMAQDAGERAPVNDWIADASARSFVRYEITVTDPLTQRQGYFYLHRSTTLPVDPLLATYVRYTPGPGASPAADTVKGVSYTQGHAATGVPEYLAVPPSFGGTGVDFMDRFKLRIRAVLGFITITLNERDNLRAKSVRAVSGRIRVIREVEEEILLGTSVLATVRIALFFYPYSSQLSGTLDLTSSLGARLLRSSFDFNAAVQNQPWHNQNTGPRTITGASGGLTPPNNSIVYLPNRNWFSVLGTHGSFIGTFGMEDIANTTEQFYFWDSPSGTADGTTDTGDNMSFADTGFLFMSGSTIVARVQMGMTAFVLQPALTRAQAIALNANTATPTQSAASSQAFDATPPAIVSDLRINTSTNTSVTLAWTAPADVGSAVNRYEAGYSTTPVGADPVAWFNTIAQKAANLPAPLPAGSVQFATIDNLTTGARYFFLLRSIDDFGNASGLSNVATIDAVPVELATFTVTASRNRAELNWTTASETNNRGFEVQRRSAIETNWRVLGFVPGHGTTTQQKQYAFVDPSLQPGAYSYRLRQLDYDGQFEFSAERNLAVQVPQRFGLAQSYPNPFFATQSGTLIRYELSNPEPVQVELRVYNLLGHEVRRLVETKQSGGYYEVRWNGRFENGEPVPAGIYFYELRAGGLREMKKLTLVR